MAGPAPERSADPGVPEALPRTLIRLRDRLGVHTVERLWIFPPHRKGRRERGLIAVSTFLDGADRRSEDLHSEGRHSEDLHSEDLHTEGRRSEDRLSQDRRSMVTVAYSAEHTGTGVTLEPTFTLEGEATPDRFPGVMRGVVRRAGEEQGDAREVEIDGSAQRFEELMQEFDDELGRFDEW